MYKVVTGHVAVGPDQIGLVAADNRTRANHRFKFRAIGASSSSSSSQIPAESSAHNASVPGELWTQRDQPVLECVK